MGRDKNEDGNEELFDVVVRVSGLGYEVLYREKMEKF